jgi:hypothetical protein
MLEYRNVAPSNYTLGVKMRRVIGSLLIAVTVAIGAYLAIVPCFFFGVIQIVDAANATVVNGPGIAWGLVRVLILPASTAFTTWFIVVLVGGYLLDWNQTEPYELKIHEYQ